jgi:hypothetical protein
LLQRSNVAAVGDPRIALLERLSTELGIIDSAGRWTSPNSLQVVDIVTRIEDELKLTVPVEAITLQSFQSLESLCRMVDALGAAEGS